MRKGIEWTSMLGWGGALALTICLSGATRAQEGELHRIDERRAVAADVEVSVEAVIREVRVTAWDRDEIRVRGAIHSDREEFVLEGDRQSVEIAVERTDDGSGSRRGHLPDPGPLEVSVPRGGSVQVQVVNGGVTVDSVAGSVEIESVNGGIRYSGPSESVEAEAVNGSVRLDARRSRSTRVSSVNGRIVLRVRGGFVEAEAVSGDVEIRADEPVETLSARTVSGGIEFRGRPAREASLSLETHSGDVVLRLPEDLSARLDASTFSGHIESAFGGTPEKAGRWTPEESYRHTVGAGGARISASSFSGDVRFETPGG